MSNFLLHQRVAIFVSFIRTQSWWRTGLYISTKTISLFAFLQFYPVLRRNGKVHYSTSSILFIHLSLFLFTITRSGCLAKIRWSVYISKSQRILCLVFLDWFWVMHITFYYNSFFHISVSRWFFTGVWVDQLSYPVIVLLLLLLLLLFTHESFSHQLTLMVFHWSLSDSKFPQVSRTLLSILAVLNNAVVWMVSTRPPASQVPLVILYYHYYYCYLLLL